MVGCFCGTPMMCNRLRVSRFGVLPAEVHRFTRESLRVDGFLSFVSVNRSEWRDGRLIPFYVSVDRCAAIPGIGVYRQVLIELLEELLVQGRHLYLQHVGNERLSRFWMDLGAELDDEGGGHHPSYWLRLDRIPYALVILRRQHAGCEAGKG